MLDSSLPKRFWHILTYIKRKWLEITSFNQNALHDIDVGQNTRGKEKLVGGNVNFIASLAEGYLGNLYEIWWFFRNVSTGRHTPLNRWSKHPMSYQIREVAYKAQYCVIYNTPVQILVCRNLRNVENKHLLLVKKYCLALKLIVSRTKCDFHFVVGKILFLLWML